MRRIKDLFIRINLFNKITQRISIIQKIGLSNQIYEVKIHLFNKKLATKYENIENEGTRVIQKIILLVLMLESLLLKNLVVNP